MSEQKQKKQLTIFDTLSQKESSLMQLVNKFKSQLLKRAADTIRNSSQDKQDQFLSRIILSIAKNEKLKECFLTEKGRVSIFMIIDNCLRTGLELDKHAYAVPYGERNHKGIYEKIANFQIKKEGYRIILTGGQKPILKEILCRVVYEKEKDLIKINKATGEVDHSAFIGGDPGKIIGVWVQITHLSDRKEIDFFPIKRIYEIRDTYSKTYQKWIENNELQCAWVTDEIKMVEKTAIKSMCREYADCSEALSYAYYCDDNEPFNDNKKDNIVDIAETVIDDAIDRLDTEIENKPEIVEEKEPENKENKEKKSLF